MKKNKDKIIDIVLDEENKSLDKEKPTAKKIVLAVLLILLAVGLVCLGFCLTFGVFDTPIDCNVAFAYNWSGPTLADLDVGDAVYGFKITDYTGFFALLDRYAGSCAGDSSRIAFSLGSGGDAILNLSFHPNSMADDGLYSLYLDWCDWGSGDDVYAPISVIACCNLSAWTGNGFFYFDSPVVLNSYYPSNPTVCDSLLWDNVYLQVLTTPIENSGDYYGLISQIDDLTATNNELQKKLDKYEDMFTCKRTVYNGCNNSTSYDREKIDVSLLKKVFITKNNVDASALVDNDGNFIGAVYGLNPSVLSSSGIWNTVYDAPNDFDSLYFFYFIAKMALLTPNSYDIRNYGIIWSYDVTTKTLIKFTDVYTVATVEMADEYELLYRCASTYGHHEAETDLKNTTDGVISVLQSPINFLKNIFDFEVFGINLSALVFFILSVVIVAFVIKKVV